VVLRRNFSIQLDPQCAVVNFGFDVLYQIIVGFYLDRMLLADNQLDLKDAADVDRVEIRNRTLLVCEIPGAVNAAEVYRNVEEPGTPAAETKQIRKDDSNNDRRNKYNYSDFFHDPLPGNAPSK
jgi:hypothetical protein